jgi:hypothetical protein
VSRREPTGQLRACREIPCELTDTVRYARKSAALATVQTSDPPPKHDSAVPSKVSSTNNERVASLTIHYDQIDFTEPRTTRVSRASQAPMTFGDRSRSHRLSFSRIERTAAGNAGNADRRRQCPCWSKSGGRIADYCDVPRSSASAAPATSLASGTKVAS